MYVALTVAGSDSGGGAGIQADLKTFHQYGVFGTSAVTAVTAQNTEGVTAVSVVPPDAVRAQIQAVMSDLRPTAIKTGMLATAEIAEVVATALAAYRAVPIVVDPVMVATSGDRLLDADATTVITNRLLPLASVVTPNLAEAALLVGHDVQTFTAMEQAGMTLLESGARGVLVKGGHLDGSRVVDVLVTRDGTRTWERGRIETSSTHGTGCTLSAAIAACLAIGAGIEDSVDSALAFVHEAISNAPGLGAGHGPLNHFAAARVPAAAEGRND